MTIDGYHGTTAENVPGIVRGGLRIGSWVSPDRAVAEHFARTRAAWNGFASVVFRVRVKVRKVRRGRSGHLEAVAVRVLLCEKVGT